MDTLTFTFVTYLFMVRIPAHHLFTGCRQPKQHSLRQRPRCHLESDVATAADDDEGQETNNTARTDRRAVRHSIEVKACRQRRVYPTKSMCVSKEHTRLLLLFETFHIIPSPPTRGREKGRGDEHSPFRCSGTSLSLPPFSPSPAPLLFGFVFIPSLPLCMLICLQTQY